MGRFRCRERDADDPRVGSDRRKRVGPHDQGPLRTPVAGDLCMSMMLLWSVTTAQMCLGLAMGCAVFRAVRGPRAQDRVVGFDSLYVSGMLLVLTFGIRAG